MTDEEIKGAIEDLDTRLRKIEHGAQWPTAAVACTIVIVTGWLLVELIR